MTASASRNSEPQRQTANDDEGAPELYEHVTSQNLMKSELGQPLEVRFENVSMSADVIVKDETQPQTELPTLSNVILKGARQLGAKSHVVKKSILRNASGVFKPGTMTLILGQPGSGKSSLMKLLSGRLSADRNVMVEGGYPSAYFNSKGDARVAHECSEGTVPIIDEQQLGRGDHGGDQHALDAANAVFKNRPDIVIRQLGLENCQDTLVGDAMLRGVSGGERKRVTTGEMTFGNKLVYFMDEISTGSDSSATFDIISNQRRLAKTLGKTMVISLLQPSPEGFELFDDVMLLNGGYVMYYGPRAELGGYFEDLGLKCPASRDMADFLLDLGTNKQRQYESGPAPRFAPQFADVFEKSEVRFRMMNNLRNPWECSTEPINSVAHTPEFRQDFLAGTATVLAREFKILAHDLAAVKIQVFMALVIALLYGTAFYQFETTNAQVFMGLAFTTVDTLSVAKIAPIPSILATRNVVYKQRGANFYRTSSFGIASSVKESPLVVVEILLFGP
ncbi:ATP-binding Cassette (ABC) Superfamily [Phytophthora infestans T30-4]|uniref:ATP-binding Cassette (ABC) Superfamily n=1 Tax=Phytophthora infestans (strain T30-4) TaxID=403677 RepID=D0P0P5_PHYIT|nr:ATP-binding Cassette (ABC) Superfamily [Phytophthora infestans T30-4]EEY53012.1 ATP-binding Cassette (ABC) Superfamily [Phytophthora infestans T30-4]|eukprot:XP_002896140.1 ATP-binding Cassette (ABC) Superfamily [Phytophthora infestans T30-4]